MVFFTRVFVPLCSNHLIKQRDIIYKKSNKSFELISLPADIFNL